MSWNEVEKWIKAFWAGHYMWFVLALILVAVGSILGNIVAKKKMTGLQAVVLTATCGIIYILGDLSNVSALEWFISSFVIAFGLWRLYFALEPKDWNGSKELVSGKVITSAAIHFPGLLDCIIFHTLLIWLIWSPNLVVGLVLLAEIAFGHYLGGMYNPKLRERWVLFFFDKPRYALVDLASIKDEHQRLYEQRVRQRYGLHTSRLWNFLLCKKMWMDNGLNFIRMRSWFPEVSIGVVPCEVQELNGPKEKGYKTDWIPTGPNLFENNDDRNVKTIDVKKASQTNGPPLMFTYKLTVALYDPRPYFHYSDADRGDREKFAGVMVRQAEGQLNHVVSMLSYEEAQARNSYGLSIAEINYKRSQIVEKAIEKALRDKNDAEVDPAKKLSPAQLRAELIRMKGEIYSPINIVNEGMSYDSFFQSVQGELQVHTGARLITFQIMDITPAQIVEEAQKRRTVANIDAETAEAEAKALRTRQLAQGESLSLEAGAVAAEIYKGNDPVEMALARREALKIVIARRLAENAGTIPFPTNIFKEIFGNTEK